MAIAGLFHAQCCALSTSHNKKVRPYGDCRSLHKWRMKVLKNQEVVEEIKGKEANSERIGISIWTVVLGILGSLLIIYYGWYAEIYQAGADIPCVSPYQEALGLLFVGVLIVNLLHKYTRVRVKQARANLLLFYVILSIASGMTWTVLLVTTQMTGPQYLAFTTPKVYEKYIDSISGHIIPKGNAVLDAYMGASAVPWTDWIFPLVTWASFFVIVILTMICTANLFRQRWIVEEKLTFPLAIPVIELTAFEGENVSPIWRNKLMWAGFAIAGIVVVLEFLHSRYPVIPFYDNKWYWFGTKILQPFVNGIGGAFGEAFFRRTGGNRVSILPLYLGIGYFVNTSILFSVFLFKLVEVFLEVYRISVGENPSLPNSWDMMSVAGLFGLGLFYTWLMRTDLKQMIKGIFSKQNNDDSAEGMSARIALVGVIMGLVAICVFGTMVFGASPVWVMIFVLIWYFAAIGTLRMRAEAGVGVDQVAPTIIDKWILMPAAGSRMFGMNNAVRMGFLSMLGYYPGPGAVGGATLEGYKYFEDSKTQRIQLTKLVIGAFLVLFALAIVTGLNSIYDVGLFNAKSRWNSYWNRFGWSPWVEYAEAGNGEGNLSLYVWFIGGAFFAIVLGYLRNLFLWWPLHPIGYVAAFSNMSWVYVGSFSVAWLAKVLIFRFGGASAYKSCRPFFLGLIAGASVLGFLTFVFDFIRTSMLV